MHPSALAKRLYILLFIVIVALYLYGLGSLPLLGPDEPRYAQVAREMFVRGDLITPTLGGHTWFEKPALLYWLMIAAYKVFGVSEFSARLGPALCGLLTVAAVWRVGRAIETTDQTDGSDQVQNFAFWSTLVAASALGLIVFSRAASFDVVITMTTTWSLAFFIMHKLDVGKKSVLLIGFYICVGLSLLAKGLVGLVIPFGVVGSYYLIRREWPNRQLWLSLIWGVPLATAVSALWYGPVIARHGWPFIDEFFLQHHFARYVSNKYHHPQPIYFYPAIILMLALPWTGYLVEALAKIRGWAWRENDALSIARVFSLAWLLFPIVFFSFSGSKLPGYILPALPAAAFLISDRLQSTARWPVLTTGVICLALAVGGFVYAIQSGHISIACGAAMAIPMVVAAGASFFLRDQRVTFAMVIAGSTFVLVMLVAICAAPRIAQRESVKALLELADARGYGNAPVLAQRSDDRSAQFYAHDRVIYNAEGEPVTFDEVTVDQARALGGRILVFIQLEYVDEFRGAPSIEILGDNGRMAVLGWKP
ncbi:MAG TPA: glycosyltransferase family 39 protein [Pyrinomonadaceae bacterium]|nr:glycosyltransferase family 39 protein [Pyrinomonadaceae bacterium]